MCLLLKHGELSYRFVAELSPLVGALASVRDRGFVTGVERRGACDLAGAAGGASAAAPRCLQGWRSQQQQRLRHRGG
jgi:hypothetical protein